MTRTHSPPMWQRAVTVLTGAAVICGSVLALNWGRPVLVPVALAILLTFLLNPVVRFLERRGLWRVLSVIMAVSLAGIMLLSLGWIVTQQVTGMMAKLPQNTAKIKAKVQSLRKLAAAPFANKFGTMFEEISETAAVTPSAENSEQLQASNREGQRTQERPAEVMIVRTESSPWLNLSGYLGSVFDVFATAAFTIVLLVVFLIERDDLRDRIVLLAGKSRLAVTSKALDDMTERISRYIAMVAILNGGYGLMLTAGLLVCGVPYALLWGFLSAGMRFIPYIGPWIGGIFPIIMSLATSNGWGPPIAVFAFIAALELISNNIIEPLVFGRSTGVSPTALLISAASWLYLWGPIGLVLSAPFAVCLVVVGKNIPQLSFLHLLLGDKPAVCAATGIYLRLLQQDQLEVSRLIRLQTKEHAPEQVFDEILLPALTATRHDILREQLTGDDRQTLLSGMQAALVQTATSPAESAPLAAHHVAQTDTTIAIAHTFRRVRVLGCPGTDEIDVLALEMLRQLLDPMQWELELTSEEMLTSELTARIIADPPEFLCIASLPPGGIAHARYLCKRLRAASPTITIIVGRWCRSRNNRIDRERLLESGANFVTTTLLETRQLLESRRPLVSCEPTAVSAA